MNPRITTFAKILMLSMFMNKFLTAAVISTVCELCDTNESKNPTSRVAAGYLALDENQFPFVVGLLVYWPQNHTLVCTASILSNTKLLTAAHCWDDGYKKAHYLTAVYGGTSLMSNENRVDTALVKTHPGYNPATSFNDIAIVTIPFIEFTASVAPILLAPVQPVDFYNDRQAALIGYGIRNPNDADIPERVLNFRCVNTIPLGFLRTILTRGKVLDESVGVCNGDGGAPLVIQNYRQYQLIGVASHSSDCFGGRPSMYARVTYFVNWILEDMGINPEIYYSDNQQ